MPSVADLTRFIWNHPSNRGARVRALTKAFAWQIYKRTTGRPWDLNVRGTHRLRCYPDSTSASLMLYCNDRPDYDEMSFMEHYLRPGDRFLDVGANIGAYTIFAASLVGPTGGVDAFEPGGHALARLRENVALNHLPNVVVHALAVSDAPGRVQFLSELDSANRIQTESDVSETASAAASIRLDEYLAPGVDAPRFALGKMDIEGAEPLAFRGAERMLGAGNPPVWLIELNGNLRAYGFDESGLQAWLGERGYAMALYDAERRALTYPESPWEGARNVLVVSQAHQDEIEARVRR